ncbi:ATP-dependent helicase HrpB [Thioalkalivibrio sp. K90mix]|uniref:ATP-dependent helicase HrpB n=1 Tax=Thioalkalivibrio sp. (strain K90mix) TaxID=396595 RepID=UPI00019597AA|nr:ATP-dependent helicase HrpB [Thioalkalivibrio sp. K90mix]ADC72552.1 ATP-dependent helicase HrpB [Thioalkalivibrio sp. K90mix]
MSKDPSEAPQARALEDLLNPLDAALESRGAAVLVAEPGAGKTTRVPLHLAACNREDRVIVLQPRRLAARMAATYMAGQLGESAGQTVGYRVRDEQKVSERTRVELVTDGLFLRRIQGDPLLEGVGTVVFDEFHLRRPEAELALAFALQVRRLLRPELRIVVMSATLDDEAVARLLAGPEADAVAVLRARGRQFPVEVRYAPTAKDAPLADGVAQAVRDALAVEPGSILVFLPGEREIREVAARLGEGVDTPAGPARIAPLFGRLSAQEQARAVRPAPAGERKVVLATDIAETSLTIEGVRVVIDTGLSREPRFDAATGLSRLVTRPASKAAAEQRAGRAGRTESGVAIRLWSRADEVARPDYATPGMQQVDLLPLALELAGWGEAVAELDWLEPPPAQGLASAQAVLAELGAVDADGRVTGHGQALLRLPAHPRLAHMLLRGRERGLARLACELAVAVEEPGVAGPEPPLELGARLERARRSGGRAWPSGLRRLEQALARVGGRPVGTEAVLDESSALGVLAALAWPERIARRRGEAAGRFVMGNGRGAWLPERERLAHTDYLVAVDCTDADREARIRCAVALDLAALEQEAPELFHRETRCDWVEDGARLENARVRRIGTLVVERQMVALDDPAATIPRWCERLRREGLALLPWDDTATQLRARIQLLHEAMPEGGFPDLRDTALLRALEDWLGPYLAGITRRRDLERLDLAAILRARLDWDHQQQLEREAPARIEVPSGSAHRIDYTQDPPVLAVKLQELFGLGETPRVAGGRMALVLHLLSPARRPVQVTQDLKSFWENGYPDVRRELKGRYPKHPWPEDPWNAPATRHTKRRG